METEKIIKQLEDRKLELQLQKIDLEEEIMQIESAIEQVQKIGTKRKSSMSPKLVPTIGVRDYTKHKKRKYVKSGKYKVENQIKRMEKGRKKRRKFNPEVQKIIQKNIDKTNTEISEILKKELGENINAKDISKIICYRKLRKETPKKKVEEEKEIEKCCTCGKKSESGGWSGKKFYCVDHWPGKKKKNKANNTEARNYEDEDMDDLIDALE